jgi:hypothetical protein
MKIVKCLLGVELFEISNKFIYKLREKHKNTDEVFDYIPEFTINTNEGQHNQPIRSECFHQFVGIGENEEEKYLYFDLHTVDSQLDYEISQTGIEDLFKEQDFKKILSKFTPHSDDDLSNFILPKVYYLIVVLIYETYQDYYNGGWEYDMEVDIIGYLDENFNAINFE